jgi:hypothetical protein
MRQRKNFLLATLALALLPATSFACGIGTFTAAEFGILGAGILVVGVLDQFLPITLMVAVYSFGCLLLDLLRDGFGWGRKAAPAALLGLALLPATSHARVGVLFGGPSPGELVLSLVFGLGGMLVLGGLTIWAVVEAFRGPAPRSGK